MTILAIHRKKPNWPADPLRPIFPFGALFVETDGPEPTQQEVDAIMNPPPQPARLPLEVVQQRLELEGGWDTYVNYMFGTNARRNAFVKTMFIGKPIRIEGDGFVASLQGAGFTVEQIGRITAPLA